jgi:hypothetical protein
MTGWDITISSIPYGIPPGYLPDILWKYYRNGIAHGFVIENGNGIDYRISPKPWEVQPPGLLLINPVLFFHDFMVGLSKYLADIGNPHIREHRLFLSRFREVYPH